MPQVDPGSPLGARRQAEAAQRTALTEDTSEPGGTRTSDTAADRVDTSRWVASAGRKCGNASWYGSGGSHTASGERFASGALTAAHRSLPFGTQLLVTDMETNRSLLVRVNDRGPFTRSRVIDLSRGAARELGFVGRGVIPVCMAIVG
ncbi:septal ring lytic transglycosylase RlpA family protein [Segnochrobactrum spirostomi]|uniref:septal ring lytic transglycosylase RlpA family protein n=1 Tax=Segnochrobactrum spirostomi TaxID=2608987 RepID=UPI001FEBEC15